MKNPSLQKESKLLMVGVLICLSFIYLVIGCSRQKAETATKAEGVEIVTTEMQPDAYFHEAVNAFVVKDYKTSSDAIQKGIDAMNVIADVVAEPHKTKIKQSMSELSDLRSNVLADKVDGLDELNYFFARAGQALVGVHMHVSEAEFYNLNGKRAGLELKKAIAEIEGTIEFHDRKLDAEEVKLLDQIKAQADLLEQGKDVPKTEIENSLKELGNHLNKWSNEIEVNYKGVNKKSEVIIHNKI